MYDCAQLQSNTNSTQEWVFRYLGHGREPA